jgi:hypothetical protein
LRPGAISESNSSHLPPREASKLAKPVTFPPGRSTPGRFSTSWKAHAHAVSPTKNSVQTRNCGAGRARPGSADRTQLARDLQGLCVVHKPCETAGVDDRGIDQPLVLPSAPLAASRRRSGGTGRRAEVWCQHQRFPARRGRECIRAPGYNCTLSCFSAISTFSFWPPRMREPRSSR